MICNPQILNWDVSPSCIPLIIPAVFIYWLLKEWVLFFFQLNLVHPGFRILNASSAISLSSVYFRAATPIIKVVVSGHLLQESP